MLGVFNYPSYKLEFPRLCGAETWGRKEQTSPPCNTHRLPTQRKRQNAQAQPLAGLRASPKLLPPVAEEASSGESQRSPT